MVNKCLTTDFWNSTFEKKGFKPCYAFSPEWKFTKPGDFRNTWMWYEKNDFLLAYDAQLILRKKYPIFLFVYKPCECLFHASWSDCLNCESSAEVLQLVEAVADPSLMPLCIHIKWASNLVSACLKDLSDSPQHS